MSSGRRSCVSPKATGKGKLSSKGVGKKELCPKVIGGAISARGQLNVIMREVRERLSRKNLEAFRRTCFGHLLDVPLIQYQGQLIFLMLNALEPESEYRNSMSFMINDRRMELGRTEFFCITGLSFKETVDLPTSSGLHNDIFLGNPNLKAVDIDEAFKNYSEAHNGNGSLVLRLALLHVVYGLLMNKDQIFKKIAVNYMHLVEDIDAFNKYPWGKVAYDFLVYWTHLARSNINRLRLLSERPATDVCGFSLTIQIFAFEVMPALARHCATRTDRASFPRLMRWTTETYYKYNYLMSFFQNNAIDRMMSFTVSDDEVSRLTVVGLGERVKLSPKKKPIELKLRDEDDDPNRKSVELRRPPRQQTDNVCKSFKSSNTSSSSSGKENNDHTMSVEKFGQVLLGINVMILTALQKIGDIEKSVDELKKMKFDVVGSVANKCPQIDDNVNPPNEKQDNDSSSIRMPNVNEEIVKPHVNENVCEEDVRTAGMSNEEKNDFNENMKLREVEGDSWAHRVSGIDINKDISCEYEICDLVVYSPDISPHNKPPRKRLFEQMNTVDALMSETILTSIEEPPPKKARKGSVMKKKVAKPLQLASLMSEVYIPIHEYQHEVVKPFHDWYSNCRKHNLEQKLHLPTECVGQADVEWFFNLYTSTGWLRCDHCDVILNLLIMYSHSYPDQFLHDWTVIESIGWQTLALDNMEPVSERIMPYVEGNYPQQGGKPWHEVKKVYGIANINDIHWVAYMIELMEQRITIFDSLSDGKTHWDDIKQAFSNVCTNLPVLCEHGDVYRDMVPKLMICPVWELVRYEHPPTTNELL